MKSTQDKENPSQNHPALFYLTQKGLDDELIEFLSEGLSKHERCIFLTTQNNADEIYDRLCSSNKKSDVLKYFSYYHIPDPKNESQEFKTKMNLLKEKFLNEKFEGRIGFNVLDDISKFSLVDISAIENFEKYLHKISNDKLKLFCSFKVANDGKHNSTMIKMAMQNHDHILFEK